MDFIYKPTEYEIKLMILYTLKELKMSTTYTMLDYVISSCAYVNYFELEQYITELMQKDNITTYEADGESYYSIAQAGEETIGFFANKIPGSIRLKLQELIEDINRKNAQGNELYADYFPINENEYTVKFSMKESGVIVFELEFYAGSKERASQICRYLRRDNADFYLKMMEVINQGVSEQTEQ